MNNFYEKVRDSILSTVIVMICIECGNGNIKCLYSRFKSEYIRLTVCPECGQIADKYIEYDSVILFLDILLLKKQAYRHLSYNSTEIDLVEQVKEHPGGGVIEVLYRYKQLMKVMLIIILFEVYLIWANEEKQQTHSETVRSVLDQPVLIQYVYFISKSVLEKLIFNIVVVFLFRKFCDWGSNNLNININIPNNLQFGYTNSVLIITVLVANSIKLFPILMLIWPYDKTFISRPLFDSICFLNLIEAIHVVTNYKYTTTTLILVFSVLVETCLSTLIHSILTHNLIGVPYIILLQEKFKYITNYTSH